ncbi:MAG: patatin-like phospholipase family protein [Bryobacteraceae bacterium]
MAKSVPTMRYILAIRGGGISGIIPTCCLMKLELQLGGLARDHIAYCAGTSTGSLVTAAVAAGVPAAQILKIYTERSKDIFTPTGAVADAKLVAEGFRYNPANLRDVLASVIGPAASWVVNDCPIGVMISATAMNGHNWFFVKDNARNSRTTGSVKLVDAAVASACAPTYFDHWTIDNLDGRSISFFDGGTGGTTNPTYQACVEAFEYDTFAPDATRVIELGTGYFPVSNKPPSGLFKVLAWTANTLIDTSEDWVDEAVNRQWPGIVTTVNPALPSDIEVADLSAIPTLLTIGQELAATLDWTKLIS